MGLIEFSDVLGITIVIYVAVLATNNTNLEKNLKKGVLITGGTLSVVYLLDMLWYFVLYTSEVSERSDFVLNFIASMDYLMIPIILSSLFIVYGPKRGSFKYVFSIIGIIILAVADIINIFVPVVFYHKNLQMYYAPSGLAMYVLCMVVFIILLADMVLIKSFDYEDIFLVAFVGITMAIGVIAAWFNYDLRTLWEGLGIAYLLMYLAVSELYNKTDVITGLPNRNAYEKAMAHIRDNFKTILMVDMNGLKNYNDTKGHKIGDKYIYATAKTLADAFENKGKLYRVGGDEFCFVSKYSGEEVERIVREVLEKGKCADEYGDFKIDFAYGIAERREGDTTESIYERADKLMYENKHNSKKR
ncbi:GGDEF domain-containing protein [Butyrivibrio sp. AE3004]|uniref:GGDEF domain-containing protein n=1 Tax=Butyrivibrio sp. AE3004 TaxID=1506994 RepID=UPI000494937A|nr:GGDEF domain-containing protein [Butyrivibrio sp. AE3004]